jgi:hypothetical protein
VENQYENANSDPTPVSEEEWDDSEEKDQWLVEYRNGLAVVELWPLIPSRCDAFQYGG